MRDLHRLQQKWFPVCTYKRDFNFAIDFSTDMGYSLDSKNLDIAHANINNLIINLSNLIPEILEELKSLDRNPVLEFGAQCANTHIAVLKFIQKKYPELSPNLTIGEFGLNSNILYPFSREMFKNQVKVQPEIVECHTWITLGSETIIDCTGPTYLQTRVNKLKSLGGIAHGKAGDLIITPIYTNNYSSIDTETRGLRYMPVALGEKALYAIAPKFNC